MLKKIPRGIFLLWDAKSVASPDCIMCVDLTRVFMCLAHQIFVQIIYTTKRSLFLSSIFTKRRDRNARWKPMRCETEADRVTIARQWRMSTTWSRAERSSRFEFFSLDEAIPRPSKGTCHQLVCDTFAELDKNADCLNWFVAQIIVLMWCASIICRTHSQRFAALTHKPRSN